MRLPIPVCRAIYRTAYTALRAWWFVRRPTIDGVKCVLTDGDSVLLVRHTYGHRDWDLPGGAVRRGEAPHATATREMREELGVSIDGWTDLGQLRGRIDFRRDHMHLFHSELDGQPITMDRCELAAVRWFRRGELPPDLGRFVVQILSALGDG